MKKGRIFPIVLYYVFTFAIGILLALGLPLFYGVFDAPADFIHKCIDEGNYDLAVIRISNCYNKTPVVDAKLGDGGIVLYEAVMQYDKTQNIDADEGEDGADDARGNGSLYKAYVGFVYGVSGSYKVFDSDVGNLCRLAVMTSVGERTVPLLDYDSDANGSKDGNSMYTKHGFIMLEIDDDMLSDIVSLTFYDSDGIVYGQTVTPVQGAALDFESEFFSAVDEIDRYNDLLLQYSNTGSEGQKEQLSEQLAQLFSQFESNVTALDNTVFVSKSHPEDCPEYVAAQKAINKSVNRKSIPIVIVYFVAIYIIGDFLLGTHFIIKFFRWLLYGVFRIKPRKSQPKLKRSEIFGSDYYSQVTLTLDVSQADGLDTAVQIKYTNSDAQVVFVLLRDNGYTATQRIKAGAYVNPFIEIDRGYAPVDLPDNLVVEGYKMDVTVKIIKREE